MLPMPPNALMQQPQAPIVPNGAANALMRPQPMGQPQPNPVAPQQPQPSMDQIQELHEHFTDMQEELKKLIKLPDSELNISAVLGGAGDLVNKFRISRGRRGADAVTVAKELSGPDFPREVNGKQPTPQDIRKYLLKHFNMYTQLQANVTRNYSPPMPKPLQPQTPQAMGEMQRESSMGMQ